MKKFFALFVCALVLFEQIFAWFTAGTSMSIPEHTIMLTGVFAIGCAFLKNVELKYWKDTISSTGGAMIYSAIVLILAQAFSVDFLVMEETQADVLQCLPVWILLTGASISLWAGIYHGNFDPFVKSVENLVKATASLCTSLAILATCAIADHWVAISEIIIDVVKLAITISAIVWTILLIIFLWQNRKEL